MNSDLQDQLLKFMSKMDQIMDSHSESIAKKESPEEEPSPIY
jgi:hypothetical protein